jgi:hypothetical protein
MLIFFRFKSAAISKEISTETFKNLYLRQKEKSNSNEEEKDNIIYFDYLLKQLESYFKAKIDIQKKVKEHSNKHINGLKLRLYQTRLCLSYLLIKCFNILNIFVLIFAINKILGIQLHNVLIKAIYEIIFNLNNNSAALESDFDKYQSFYYMNSKYFPLRSTCAFKIRELALTQTYAVTCSLPINLFNQYMFILILIWYLIIFNFNIYYLITWCICFRQQSEVNYAKEQLFFGMKSMNKHFVDNKCLRKCEIYPDESLNVKDNSINCSDCELLLKKFLYDFLDRDSIFLLKIIALNSNDALIQKLLVYFYKIFRINYKKGNADTMKQAKLDTLA